MIIENNDKKIKITKKLIKETKDNVAINREYLQNDFIDFSVIRTLQGDKRMLEKAFQDTKLEYQNG